jgi:ligand-binding sensor domain-containing protein
MKSFYILLLSLACFSACIGQVNAPLHMATARQAKLIKTPDNSPYNAVGSGIQDKKGNLWFGTAQGAYRYDGKSFTNFTTKDGLCSDAICCILEDHAGNIWFGTNAGVSRYDGKRFTNISVANGGFFSLVSPTGGKPGGKDAVRAILQDKSGKIWFGTGTGVYCYDGTSFKPFLQDNEVINKNDLELNSVQKMLQDKMGNIWFTTWFEGLCRFDGKELVNFKPNNEVWYSPVYEDRNGNIWIGRRGKGVVRYDGKTFTNLVQGGDFDKCGIVAIAEDKHGNMWFGAEADDMTMRESIGGVWRYDGKAFTNFAKKDGIGNYCVFFLLPDKANNLWVGTRNTGLYRYDGKRFVAFSE